MWAADGKIAYTKPTSFVLVMATSSPLVWLGDQLGKITFIMIVQIRNHKYREQCDKVLGKLVSI